MKSKIVFLDLEETLIDNWQDKNLLPNNIAKIKKELKQIAPDLVSIWSFAIWNEDDLLEFITSGLKVELECQLRINKFNEIPTIEEIQHIIEKREKLKYDSLVEFMCLNNKELSFIKYGLTKTDTDFWLIDDTVPNLFLENNDTNVSINLINVNTGLQEIKAVHKCFGYGE